MNTSHPVHFGRVQLRSAASDRMRELTPMFMLRFNPDAPTSELSHHSFLAIARKCKKAIDAGTRPSLEAVFVNLSGKFDPELRRMRDTYKLVTIGDWARTLDTLFAAGSDFCPKCGAKSFTYPVLYCDCCGANPGCVFEDAGGVFCDRSA